MSELKCLKKIARTGDDRMKSTSETTMKHGIFLAILAAGLYAFIPEGGAPAAAGE